MMHRSHTPVGAPHRTIAAGLFALLGAAALFGVPRTALAQSVEEPGVSQPALVAQVAEEPAAAKEEEPELPHPFFTHMGLPEGVGNFNVRLLGLATRADGKTEGGFAFHLETGLTSFIGLHIRNDNLLDRPLTEAMFQFAAYVSKDGMSGFAPIIEFEFPTGPNPGGRINTLVGFTSQLGSRRMVFTQVLHYDPRGNALDGSLALVVNLGGRIYPIVEVLGEGARGAPTVVNLLVGTKVRVNDWLLLGLAVQFPLTHAKDFSWQGAFGPDVEWKLR